MSERHKGYSAEFDYLNYPINGVMARLPMVIVRLIHNGKKPRSEALIDSGSTNTFIPRHIAESIGLKPTGENVTVIGAGARFENSLARIERISLIRDDVQYGEFKDCTVYVPLDRDKIPYIILGRDSIFKMFDIEFMENREKFILKNPGQ